MEGRATEHGTVSREYRCPLCDSSDTSLMHVATAAVPWQLYSPTSPRDGGLHFFSCATCSLVFKDPAVRSTHEQELRHYAKHDNDITEVGYREHLMSLVRPVMELVPVTAVGLDYGCGPSLSTEVLAHEQGRLCRSYDPNFFPDTALLVDGMYDFITCSEVAEHFNDPRRQFERLRGLLKPEGILALMTHLVPERFAEWWYHRDPTHVVFYSQATFDWIATHIGFQVLERRGHVALLRRC